MKVSILFASILLMAFSLKSQTNDNMISPEEMAEGWELLFDGETLYGWRAYNGDIPQTWKVDENFIYCDGTRKGDDLMTVAVYYDFDLKFEWKIEQGGNSGVLYRVRENKQWPKPWITGPEYQVLDDSGQSGKTSTGSLYDVYETSKENIVNPAMEWNSGRIRVSKGFVTHWVNGVVTVNCQLGSAEWNERVENSKWGEYPYYAKSPFGHIDFQNHGAKVWYKNIKIKKL